MKHDAKGEKAIDKALKTVGTPSSQLHRSVKASLERLRETHATLVTAFQSRARNRLERATKVRRESVAAAEGGLKDRQADVSKYAKTGYPELIEIAELQLQAARGQVEIAKAIASQQEALVAVEDGIDARLIMWLEELTVRAVSALSSDRDADVVIGLLSGGLIYAGATGGTSMVAGAAAASVVVLAADLRDKLSSRRREKGADQDALRHETAVILMDTVTELNRRWLAIVS